MAPPTPVPPSGPTATTPKNPNPTSRIHQRHFKPSAHSHAHLHSTHTTRHTPQSQSPVSVVSAVAAAAAAAPSDASTSNSSTSSATCSDDDTDTNATATSTPASHKSPAGPSTAKTRRISDDAKTGAKKSGDKHVTKPSTGAKDGAKAQQQPLGKDKMEDDILPPEDDEGSVEYKWRLVNPTVERFAQLVTQLNFRLSEGNGEAIYELGVEDNGRKKGLPPAHLTVSLETLRRMAHELGAETQVLREADGKQGRVAQVLVRKVPKALEDYTDIRIAVAGNVDSGKSTLVGVLTGSGALDNGRGLARSQIFTHKHELETGRTSAVSQAIIGFAPNGEIVNYSNVRNLTWSDVVEKASKVLTFLDLAGHERYLKTTTFGLCAHTPDYCMLVVGANMGVLRMTKEHLAISLALKVPVFIVVTKIDLAPENIYEQTLNHLQRLLKSPSAGKKLPVLVKSMEEVTLSAQNIVNDRVVPIFSLSNVTGEGLQLLRSFLNLVPSRRNWREHIDKPAEFAIDETFVVPGVGTVVAGTTTAGAVSLGQILNLGPDSRGKFIKAQVKSVHYKRTPVKRVVAGQAGSLALKKVKRSAVRKGMVLIDGNVLPGAVREFTAEVLVLYHGTTIREGYEPVLHCETIRQAARVLSIDSPIIRTGDRATIKFRFLYQPEYIKIGSRFIFREGRTKGLGRITSVENPQ